MLLEGKRCIEHQLDALDAMFLNRHADLARVRGGLLDDVLAHLILAAAKQQIVGREVGMTQHVRRHEHVLSGAIALRKVGAPGVAGEDDLEQARQSHAVLNELVDVPHAERPVRHTHGQTVDRDLGHEAFGHDFELDRVVLQPLRARELLDASDVRLPVFGHGDRVQCVPSQSRRSTGSW